jgi:integrase
VSRQAVSRYPGVYVRTSTKRRYDGRPDQCYDIKYTLPNGKPKWEKIGWASEGYTAKKANVVRGERIRSMRHGEELPHDRKRASLHEVWEKFKSWKEPRTSTSNMKSLQQSYDQIIDFFGGEVMLDEITGSRIEDFKNHIMKDRAPRTAQKILGHLQTIWGKGDQWFSQRLRDPFKHDDYEAPTVDNARMRWLSKEEADDLLAALREVDQDWYDISVLSLYSGMRQGEITGLIVGHIHPDLRMATVPAKDPRNHDRVRDVYFNSTCQEILKRRMKGRRGSDLLFPNGSLRQYSGPSKAFWRVVDDLGFNKDVEDDRWKVCFHTLRHTFATWMAMEGSVNIRTLQELLGHKTIQMTMRYAKFMPNLCHEAVNKIDML